MEVLNAVLLAVVAGAGVGSAFYFRRESNRTHKRRQKLDELKAKQDALIKAMESDSRKRIRFVNVVPDGENLVKFRIRNRSESEANLQWPLIGVRTFKFRTTDMDWHIHLQPGCEDVIEAEISYSNIKGIDASEFEILDTGWPNKA